MKKTVLLLSLILFAFMNINAQVQNNKSIDAKSNKYKEVTSVKAQVNDF